MQSTTRPRAFGRRSYLARDACLAAAFVLQCAVPAHAQSSARVYGVLDEWVGQTVAQPASGPKQRTTAVASGGMTTSYWGLTAAEDLGGGLSAGATLDSFVRVDSGDAGRSATDGYFARNALVYLSSATLGELSFGRISTPTIGALFITSAFLDSSTFGSGFVNHWSGSVLGDTAMNNAVRYISPAAAGFRAFAMYSLGEERTSDPDKARGRAFDARLDYSRGPWLATFAVRRINASNGANGLRQSMLIAGAAYDFGPARVFGQYVSVDDRYTAASQNTDRAGATLGVRVSAGAGAIIGSYSRSSIDDKSAATPSRRSTVSAGYDHYLSKRTDLYAAVMRDTLSKPTGTTTTRAGIGIRHRF